MWSCVKPKAGSEPEAKMDYLGKEISFFLLPFPPQVRSVCYKNIISSGFTAFSGLSGGRTF